MGVLRAEVERSRAEAEEVQSKAEREREAERASWAEREKVRQEQREREWEEREGRRKIEAERDKAREEVREREREREHKAEQEAWEREQERERERRAEQHRQLLEAHAQETHEFTKVVDSLREQLLQAKSENSNLMEQLQHRYWGGAWCGARCLSWGHACVNPAEKLSSSTMPSAPCSHACLHMTLEASREMW